MNALSSFQRLMDSLMGVIPFAKIYLGDVVIFSSSFDKHVAHVKHFVRLVSKHGLKLKFLKCEFAKSEMSLSGHTVSA